MDETKTSRPSWAKIFSAALTTQPGKPGKRLAVVGIGNELNADDGAGVLVVRRLAARWKNRHTSGGLLLIDAGPAPENFTAPLRRFQPDFVLLVDAVQVSQADDISQGDANQSIPGKIAWLDWRNADGFSASTHTLPPTLFGQFLSSELGCQVALLGIQVETVEFDRAMTPRVKRAAARLSGRLATILTQLDY